MSKNGGLSHRLVQVWRSESKNTIHINICFEILITLRQMCIKGIKKKQRLTAIVFNDPCGSSLCDPYIFVDYFRLCRQEPARLLTTQDRLYFSFQQVSQDGAQELFKRYLTRPYQGVPRIEFFVVFLWIPVVRQGVVCFLSGGLGFSWICTAIVFYDPCGSSLFVSMYLSLAFSLRRLA